MHKHMPTQSHTHTHTKHTQGLGTDDTTLVRVVVTRCEVDMVQIKNGFFGLYKKTLASFIKVRITFYIKSWHVKPYPVPLYVCWACSMPSVVLNTLSYITTLVAEWSFWYFTKHYNITLLHILSSVAMNTCVAVLELRHTFQLQYLIH